MAFSTALSPPLRSSHVPIAYRLSVFQLDLVSRAHWNRMRVVWQQHGAYVKFF